MRYGALSATAATILLAGTAAYAAQTNGSAPDLSTSTSAMAVCNDSSLSTTEQTDCRGRMNAATTEAERAQVVRTFEARKTGSTSSTPSYSTPTTDSNTPSSLNSNSPSSGSSGSAPSAGSYSGSTGSATTPRAPAARPPSK